MSLPTKFETDLTIRSFAYVARQMAKSANSLAPTALYDQILAEAEKHCGALRLIQRDLIDKAEQQWRGRTLTAAEFERSQEAAVQGAVQAQQAIALIAAQYAPQKLAA